MKLTDTGRLSLLWVAPFPGHGALNFVKSGEIKLSASKHTCIHFSPFLTVDMMWLFLDHTALTFPQWWTVCSLDLWAPINSFLPKLFLSRYFITANRNEIRTVWLLLTDKCTRRQRCKMISLCHRLIFRLYTPTTYTVLTMCQNHFECLILPLSFLTLWNKLLSSPLCR